MADTPRDETAFSVDPFTGAPAATGAQLAKANGAMQQLAKGLGEETPHIAGLDVEPLDDAGYHEAVSALDVAVEAEEAEAVQTPVVEEPAE